MYTVTLLAVKRCAQNICLWHNCKLAEVCDIRWYLHQWQSAAAHITINQWHHSSSDCYCIVPCNQRDSHLGL